MLDKKLFSTQSIMFMDGANGMHLQTFTIFYDGKETGIEMAKIKENKITTWKRLFTYKGKEYTDIANKNIELELSQLKLDLTI